MNGRGPILDRPLEPTWLDAALRIAGRGHELPTARELLALALGDAGLGEEAAVKTATALSRIWLAPPAENVDAIRWAVRELSSEPDLRPVHFGAILAGYPFFADLCAAVGRALALEEAVSTPDLRAKMRSAWGDRRTVHNAVQRGVKTLRAFGLLEGLPGGSDSRRGERLVVSSRASRWVSHTLLLARGSDSMDEREIASAPELFGLSLPSSSDRNYGLVERHREGGGRTVLARV
jgi:hypothetical protein